MSLAYTVTHCDSVTDTQMSLLSVINWHVVSPKVPVYPLKSYVPVVIMKCEVKCNCRRKYVPKNFIFSVLSGCEVSIFVDLNPRTVMCLTPRRKSKQQLQMGLSTN